MVENTYLRSWPSLADLGVTVEQALHRIGLRGSWTITAGAPLRLSWVVAGQRGNPFAPSVVVDGDDLAVLAAEVLARTEPERGGLDWTVDWCGRQREQAAEDRNRRAARAAKRDAEHQAKLAREAEERSRQRRIREARRILG